jgi:VanZ family protein
MQLTLSPPPHARVWFAVASLFIAAGVSIHFSDGHTSWMLGLNQVAQLLPDTFWSCITVSGLGWAVLILVSVMSRTDLGARIVLTAFLLGGVVTHTLKPWLQVARPGEVLPLDLLHFIGNPVINHHSMPSGHALAAMCMGTLWVCLIRAHAYPRWLEVLSWVITTTIAGFQMFGQAFMLTRGGPELSTRGVVQYIYETAFNSYRMGYGAAMSWMLFALIFGFGIVQLRMMRRTV